MKGRGRKVIGIVFILALSTTQVLAIQNDTKDVISRPHIEYKTDELRDPFWLPLEKEEVKEERPQIRAPAKPLPTLIIQGIVWGGVFPQAIINNKVVRPGDVIEGVRIIDISKEGVTVFFEDQEYNLSSPAGINLQGLKREPEGGEYEE